MENLLSKTPYKPPKMHPGCADPLLKDMVFLYRYIRFRIYDYRLTVANILLTSSAP
jgi:hypothetical protein